LFARLFVKIRLIPQPADIQLVKRTRYGGWAPEPGDFFNCFQKNNAYLVMLIQIFALTHYVLRLLQSVLAFLLVFGRFFVNPSSWKFFCRRSWVHGVKKFGVERRCQRLV